VTTQRWPELFIDLLTKIEKTFVVCKWWIERPSSLLSESCNNHQSTEKQKSKIKNQKSKIKNQKSKRCATASASAFRSDEASEQTPHHLTRNRLSSSPPARLQQAVHQLVKHRAAPSAAPEQKRANPAFKKLPRGA
jgi:hypothetical protein